MQMFQVALYGLCWYMTAMGYSTAADDLTHDLAMQYSSRTWLHQHPHGMRILGAAHVQTLLSMGSGGKSSLYEQS